MDNHFIAESLIKERLELMLTTIPRGNIKSAPSVEWVMDNQGVDGAAYVIFIDDNVGRSERDTSRGGKSQIVEQLWLVLITKRNVADAAGEAAREESGAIMNDVFTALMGWKPSKGHTELQRTRSPFRATTEGGFVFIPILFKTRIATTGAI